MTRRQLFGPLGTPLTQALSEPDNRQGPIAEGSMENSVVTTDTPVRTRTDEFVEHVVDSALETINAQR